jgi:hypothetical protein
MAELHESSGLHSLAALRKLEAERSQAQAEAEQRARLAAERERAREAEHRLELERRVQRSAAEARQSELVELERARLVELERAEREAQRRRDSEIALLEAQSALRQAELRFRARTARARFLSGFSAALCVSSWLCAIGLYVALFRPELERSRALLENALAGERQAERAADATRAHAAQREATLNERIAALEQARAAPSAALLVPTAPPAKRNEPRHGSPASVSSRTPCRDDGDPLNPCLKR